MAYPQSRQTTPLPNRQPQRRPNRIQQAIVQAWRRTFTRGDMLTLFLVNALLWMPAFALNTADWADGLGTLYPVITISVLLSFLLARSYYSELLALILSGIYGFATITIVYTLSLPGPFTIQGRLQELGDRLSRWGETVSNNGVGTDNLVFVIFLAVLFWFLAHNAIWQLIRLNRVWLAILPPGFVLITIIMSYSGNARLELFLLGFLLCALPLTIQVNIEAREYQWYRLRVKYPRNLRTNFLRLGTAMTILVVLFGLALPIQDGDGYWDEIKEFLGNDPLAKINDLFARLFSSLEGPGIATADYYGGDRLDLTGPVQLSDREVMRVAVEGNTSDLRLYWRSTIFDTYQNGTWTHNRSVRAYKDSPGMSFNLGDYAGRRDLVQNVEMFISASSLIYAAPQPREMGLGVDAELNCVPEGGPECVRRNQEVDVAIIRARDPLREGDDYTVTSSISVASADELRPAGTIYPEWVTRTYLQGGGSISGELRSLTEQIVSQSGAVTPYDKAKAVEQWLRANILYNEKIPTPPSNVDPIDWFIFDIREGYCNYYSSAMVMMLRSQGIPSRMAAGFAEGTYSPNDGSYLVRENDAHTWVEVFFPGFGWVEFEPTADELPLNRPGDVSFNSTFPTITPIPTSTPTSLPTNTLPPPQQNSPTPSPTPTQSPTLPPNVTPTVTPTLTPTPTFTPTFTPTATPIPPEPQATSLETDTGGGFWRVFLTILGIILATLLLIVLMVVFIIWWVEHRGLGGLNPVQKAYARLGIYGNWLGVGVHNRMTPEERRQVFVDEVPEGQHPITDITHLYIHDRFAPPAADHDTQREAEHVASIAWTKARVAFIREKLHRWLRRS